MAELPVAESCLRNQAPILAALQCLLPPHARVLELGSGTGQHAVFMAGKLPEILWQPSDLADQLPGIEAWRAQAQLPNVLPAACLDVRSSDWPVERSYDVIFTANTIHFVSAPVVRSLLTGVARHLRAAGQLCLYGPFNDGGYTSEGNRQLDQWLRARDASAGIKEIKEVTSWALEVGLHLTQHLRLPANNLMLVFSIGAEPNPV